MNLSEMIETNEGYFTRKCYRATPILLFLLPVVSRKPFLAKDLADVRVVAWLPFTLFWVEDPKGAWGLPGAHVMYLFKTFNLTEGKAREMNLM